MDKLQEIITRLKGWLFESKDFQPIETLDNYLDVEDVELLLSTVEEQQKEISTLKNGFESLGRVSDGMVDDYEELKGRNARLRESLNFYAEHENWCTYPVPGGYASAASADKGRRARKGLED